MTIPCESLYQDEIPSPESQAKIFSYVCNWIKASQDFMSRNYATWNLLDDLYHNRLDLAGWNSGRHNPTDQATRWQSDTVLSPSYIVDTWADRAYQAIFSGPEWLTLIDRQHQTQLRHGHPSALKIQELLLTKMAQGQIHARMYEILNQLILYGTVYAKLVWYSKQVTTRSLDIETLSLTQVNDLVYDCPILEIIPLPQLLPDWTATHNDVQRHSGIGHFVHRTYDSIVEQFRSGIYNLNEAEFQERWRKGDELAPLLDESQHRGGRFTVWEWHGGIPFEDGERECVCTIVTDGSPDSPHNGLLVRFQASPILFCGLRPFVAAHYIPQAGPLGLGAIESNLDLLHSISEFLSQSQDNARLSANVQMIVRRGSSAARQISLEGDVVFPGKVWSVDDPDDIRPFPPLSFPQNEVNFLIDYLNRLLEKRTAVNETSLGLNAGSRTATEAHILQESTVTPFSVRTDLFARTFLEPLGKIALEMMRQFILEDQWIHMAGDSQQTFLTVTPEEVRAGDYRVAATLTRQDATRIAKAGSIERALPNLVQFRDLLAQEGIEVSFSELLKRYLDLIGIDGTERILRPLQVKGDESRVEQISMEQAYGTKSRPQDTSDMMLNARMLASQFD